MKKNELMNGDFVVLSSGSVAVIIGKGEDAYLLFQYGGFEYLDECYDDNLNHEMEEDKIMQVFRSEGRFGFEGIDMEVPIWERDENWECPAEEEREEKHKAAVERYEAKLRADLERMDEERMERKDLIFVIAQGYYGNRTGTAIHREKINYFLKGCPSPEFFSGEDEAVERKIIKIPGSDNVVIVYDQNQEDEYINVSFPKYLAEDGARCLEMTGREMTPWVNCKIPELEIELHSRCFACRLDENGEFQSLEEDDDEVFMKYFPA